MVVFTGQTVEKAIENGLEELGLTRLRASIRVISREKKGFLGFGKKPAQVDIEPLAVDEDIVDDTPKTNKVTSITQKRLEQIAEEENKVIPMPIQAETEAEEVTEVLVEEEVVDSTPASDDESQVLEPVAEEPSATVEEAAEAVKSYVANIIYEMDIEAEIMVTTKRRQIELQIDTPEPGRVIGYHGKVLKSLQLLAQNFLYDHYAKVFTVSVNVHDYVEHRTEALIDFSKKVASRVLESGEAYTMDPMSNSERKTVHKTIASLKGVTSHSEGTDPNRYVVVKPAEV